MKLVIISGRSGSGKSSALDMLEDIGFYSIDNLPASLLPDLAKQQLKNYSRDSVEKLINSINEIELQIKKNHNNSINILLDFIITQGKIINN